ncbi:putative ABC-type transport system, periplasmic component [Vibrio nigripulchritudo MADA3029]|uniref:SgrR family transcriptional regulator n=1 Tax=Vibrio nigripulchritudo TaxID=28173 RepID=UPI0003B17F7D|nr:SgrR family transcriptional regulator [Vibrio nigripulchritudo]CCN45291.1 putative ABC-type transport system, periplasmic component [Vibrio nigripulchritudo MADA3020]CCN51739.1 putative ABC-type transport system, periplasmic component [Vibrio nigripulchritudo MADA3021]CCN61903.1 putative ABC-type transport system, periplasmic component [Vibrio nigripulchritudo MADA3029]
MENQRRKLEIYEGIFRAYGPGDSACQLSELAALLHVSERYVQTLIKKLVALGWLKWEAQSGRNKKATLSCLKEPIDACYQLAQPMAESGSVDQLLNLLGFGGRDSGKELEAFLSRSEPGVQRTLYIPFHRELENLHPLKSLRRTERFLVTQVCQRLTRIIQGEIKGDLAYHWQSNADGTCWRFQIHNGAKFHDGTSLTANDVVRCLSALIGSRYWSRLYQHINTIKALSSEVIEIQLNGTDWHLPRLFSRAETSIYKAIVKGGLVGSGAFSVAVFSSKMLRLARHTGYTHKVPFVERVELWVYPEWAESKVCAVNQLCLKLPEKTQRITSKKLSTFIEIRNSNSLDDSNERISYEDNSECKAIFQSRHPKSKGKEVPYAQYDKEFTTVFCSVIEEDDRFVSWLSFLTLFPFKQGRYDVELCKIRNTPDLKEAEKYLTELLQRAQKEEVLTLLKDEPFHLEISRKVENTIVNGFGWCELGDVWVSDNMIQNGFK